ncbi:hypothetical protein [Luteibacter sp. Lutesp34]|uniref:hypothetical protein n=1 Tax=Luteibacter sp. Lutesp34 TaxID=3243030 RepID=UPI0039B436EA
MTTEDGFGEEGARPSSLIPVHKLSTRDPLHDLQLLRDVAIINERVRRELGPPPRPASQPKPEKEREDMKPRELAMATLVAVGAAVVTPCASSAQTLLEERHIDPAVRAKLNIQPPKWPLKFKEHTFRVVCYSTQLCKVWYAHAWSIRDKPTPPSSKYGPTYLDHITGGHVGIANFPEPAEVTWRSMDGTEHQAHIDIGEIFGDEIARHDVPREEVLDLPDGELTVDPLILLEVNDRTIRVYMRTYVPTKHFQIPGNPYSNSRDEFILAKTYQY